MIPIFFYCVFIGNGNTMWTDLKPINLGKIQLIGYPDTKFFKEDYHKKQVVLHHTISGPSIDGDIESWINNKYNIGTAIIIDRAGTPWQLFSSRFWAYHLGAGNHDLDRHSIGIELDNWGGLTPGNGTLKVFRPERPRIFNWRLKNTSAQKYYTYYGNAVDVPMQYYPDGFRGYQYYEKYTEAQIRTLGELLLFWRNKYGIPLTYNESMWDVSPKALSSVPGVWTHVSYRADKSDCHPQTELIEMLKTIQTLP